MGPIGILFAGAALLFTTRYPARIFDFVLGLDRWGGPGRAYVLLMTDQYPPFRLDQAARRSPEHEARAEAPRLSHREAGADRPHRRRHRRGVIALGLLAGGCGADRRRPDAARRRRLPCRFATPSYAIVSEADIDSVAPNGIDSFLALSQSDRPVLARPAPPTSTSRESSTTSTRGPGDRDTAAAPRQAHLRRKSSATQTGQSAPLGAGGGTWRVVERLTASGASSNLLDRAGALFAAGAACGHGRGR